MPEDIWIIPNNLIQKNSCMEGFRKILFILGALFVLYGLGVVLIIGIHHWFDFFGIITGALMIAFAIGAPVFKELPSSIKLFASLIFIGTFCMFLVVQACVVRQGQSPPAAHAEYVIVLGAKVEGDTPSVTLLRRIEAASEYMLQNPRAIALTTGGCGIGEHISEGCATAGGLSSLGIDSSRILIEEESTSTRENLLYALQMIEQDGGSADSSVVIVSSAYHVFRARKLAESIGYKKVSTKGCASMPYLIPHYYAREFAALIKEKLDGHI